MKQILIRLLLFFSLVTPIVSTFFVVNSIKKEVKQVKRSLKWKMIAGLEKEELVLLKFTEEEKSTKLYWKHAKEFRYNDEMYDIVSSEKDGDTTYYWCWWDHEETVLSKRLAQLVNNVLGDNPQQSDHSLQLLKFFKSLFFSKEDQQYLYNNGPLKNQLFYYSSHYFSLAKGVPVPPPKYLG